MSFFIKDGVNNMMKLYIVVVEEWNSDLVVDVLKFFCKVVYLY